jgi:hypothetical protein
MIAMETKQPTSYRLSAEAKRLIALLAAHISISPRDVIEVAIREKAKREGIK